MRSAAVGQLPALDECWRSLAFAREFDAIDRPTLVFGGDRDPFFTPSVVRETAARLPDAELTIISGAKHAAFHERKPAFDARVRSFLER